MMKRVLYMSLVANAVRAGMALAWVLACPVAAQGSDAPTTAGITFFESEGPSDPGGALLSLPRA